MAEASLFMTFEHKVALCCAWPYLPSLSFTKEFYWVDWTKTKIWDEVWFRLLVLLLKEIILSVLCIDLCIQFFLLLYSYVTKKMECLQILSCFNQFLHLCFSADFSECLWRDKHSVSRHSGKHVITVYWKELRKQKVAKLHF